MDTTVDVTKDRIGKIGGSDLPAILEQDPYTTPYMAWTRIMGLAKVEPNENMDLGNALEPGVATALCKRRGSSGVLKPGRLVHPDHQFLISHPDYFLLSGLVRETVEIKVTSDMSWENPPPRYVTQLNHNTGMAKLNLPYVSTNMVLAVLCGKLYQFDLAYDPDQFAANVHYAAEWHMKYVERDTPPPLLTEEDVAIAHPESETGKRILMAKDDAFWLGELATADADLKLAEERVKLLKEKLRVRMADAEAAVDPDTGATLATWKTQHERGIDFNGLRQAHPQIVEAFTIDKTKRPLLLKREAIRKFAGEVW